MTDEKSDEILRNIVENMKPSSCGVHKKSWKDKIHSFNLRKTLGRKILGKPIPGSGILIQVDLARKTKEEVEEFHTAIKHLRRAGIGFDTGYGGQYDMEFDWSLVGMVAKCKRCGYNSDDNRIQLDNKEAKESK